MRDSVFDILAHSYGNPVDGARVIDLFAGTGAMAIEALSRGAHIALFVDKARTPARSSAPTSRRSISAARPASFGATRASSAPRPRERFSVLPFSDAPYGKGLVPPTLEALRAGGWLGRGVLAVIEERAGADVELPEGFVLCETRRFSTTQIVCASLS